MTTGMTIPELTDLEHEALSRYIEGEFGIKMPASKKKLIESRLHKRLNIHGFQSYGQYLQFVVKNPNGKEEFLHFADLVSTHETSFFREAIHFEILTNNILPVLLGQKEKRNLNVLSAACSSGEESYTLSMVIDRFIRINNYACSLQSEGIDLSNHSIELAIRGVYSGERYKQIPSDFQREYTMYSKDKSKNLFRIVPEIRQVQNFHAANLLSESKFCQKSYDIIFCRNILIYFDDANKKRLLNSLIRLMTKDSYLFLGHSETIMSLDLPLKSIANAVYVRN